MQTSPDHNLYTSFETLSDSKSSKKLPKNLEYLSCLHRLKRR